MGDSPVTLHRILVDMNCETQRHAGHADIIRESIGGAAGFLRGSDNLHTRRPGWCRCACARPPGAGRGRPPRTPPNMTGRRSSAACGARRASAASCRASTSTSTTRRPAARRSPTPWPCSRARPSTPTPSRSRCGSPMPASSPSPSTWPARTAAASSSTPAAGGSWTGRRCCSAARRSPPRCRSPSAAGASTRSPSCSTSTRHGSGSSSPGSSPRLIPDIPHPILALIGEQGTAKTTAARLVVSLVDPSPAPLRTAAQARCARGRRGGSASWIVALDNVSSIPAWFSDTLCKAVTGDGIVERALYTDDDINVITFRRCIALTTIDAGRLAGDLAERLLTVELARIPHRAPATRRRDRRRLRAPPSPSHLGCPARPHRRGPGRAARRARSTSCPAWPTSPASSPPSTTSAAGRRSPTTAPPPPRPPRPSSTATRSPRPCSRSSAEAGVWTGHRQRAARPHHARAPTPGLATHAPSGQRGTQAPRAGLACQWRAHGRVPAPRPDPHDHAARGRPGTCQQREILVALVALVARTR